MCWLSDLCLLLTHWNSIMCSINMHSTYVPIPNILKIKSSKNNKYLLQMLSLPSLSGWWELLALITVSWILVVHYNVNIKLSEGKPGLQSSEGVNGTEQSSSNRNASRRLQLLITWPCFQKYWASSWQSSTRTSISRGKRKKPPCFVCAVSVKKHPSEIS